MSVYIETDLRLDDFDLAQIETLIKLRIKELNQFKADNTAWFHQNLADEQLYNYRVTLKKIKAARAEVTRISNEAKVERNAAMKNGRKRS
jgi:hypothetical protein